MSRKDKEKQLNEAIEKYRMLMSKETFLELLSIGRSIYQMGDGLTFSIVKEAVEKTQWTQHGISCFYYCDDY